MMRYTVWLLLCAALLLAPLAAAASTQLESAERISDTARQFIAKRHPWQTQTSRTTVGKLDPRTRLPRCTQALEAFLPVGATIRRRTTVGVRCSSDRPWKIYLPVSVAVYAKVMVSTRPIAAGETVSRADVSWVEREVSTLAYGYLRSLQQPGGMRSRRSIPQGAVITSNMLEAGTLISKGQQITLRSNSGAIAVSMRGIALEDGSIGSRIKVRNLSSGKSLEGRVENANTVLLR